MNLMDLDLLPLAERCRLPIATANHFNRQSKIGNRQCLASHPAAIHSKDMAVDVVAR
jgi:hypothetical protein